MGNEVKSLDELDRLDRLCAEKVMGWKEPAYKNARGDDVYGFYPSGPISEWQPTRNIVHAWRCLEKITDHLQFDVTKNRSGSFIVSIWDLNNDQHIASGMAKTAPLAITLLALKSVGCEVE